jgi:hypothetical protein
MGSCIRSEPLARGAADQGPGRVTMSEYQYYEFQALDRPLSGADRQSLRELSTRAQITSTSFTNSYDWGDFKGDPAWLMERWFDLHLYLANWGSRRLMMRLPRRLVDLDRLDEFLGKVDWVEAKVTGENLILDIVRDDEAPDDDWDDGTGWLTALAPLRADVLSGDLRVFYLLWLTAVEAGEIEADALELMPGIGPMTGPLTAFADFFALDRDLVSAAAESLVEPIAITADASRSVIGSMTADEATDMLLRLHDGDPLVGPELRLRVRNQIAQSAGAPAALRTVGDLRARAQAICTARHRAHAEMAAADRLRVAAAAEQARQARLLAIARRGEGVWREVESEIERRSASAYDKAAAVLQDLRAVADQRGTMPEFISRLVSIRERHARKERFIARLQMLEADAGAEITRLI